MNTGNLSVTALLLTSVCLGNVSMAETPESLETTGPQFQVSEEGNLEMNTTNWEDVVIRIGNRRLAGMRAAGM